MIKKNENADVRKNIGKRRNKKGFNKYDFRTVLLTTVVVIITFFSILFTAKMVRVLYGATRVLLDNWVNNKTSFVQSVEEYERSI